jgi:UDP-N-acetylglucosamine 2-epimerase
MHREKEEQLKKVMIVLGTRPEAIKLAPLIIALRDSGLFHVVTCSTGQHAHMVAPVARFFGFDIDRDFGIMRPNQTLNHIVSATIAAMDGVLEEERPDWVVVQGDTSTTFAAAMAAFNRKVKIAHVEAGLRTGDIRTPFPEEANRVLVSRIADIHFPPTALAADNLAREGVAAFGIHDVGNTVIDAAQAAAAIVSRDPGDLETKFGDLSDGRTVLFTMHRRENIGEPMERAFGAVAELARRGVPVVFPMHPNPLVREPARRILGDIPGITLCEPLDYPELVHVLRQCRFVLTDSGGIVEEAAAFSKPALVLRESTERTESVDAGSAVLCGTDPDVILRHAGELVEDGETYARMSAAPNPFGDGTSSRRIVEILSREG